MFRLIALVGLVIVQASRSQCETYNLEDVKDIGAFQGSAEAKEILSKNGFVVADPSFMQIFQAYIKSPPTAEPTEKNPFGSSLPSFITPDSAWDTYHFLLEEGVKQMEMIQAQRLHDFSGKLLGAAKHRNEADLALFAAVGLALQDTNYYQALNGDEKNIVDGLRAGSGAIQVPIGFELSPLEFRAQSFYTESTELSDYFVARQWYASVVFRLSDPRETRLAVTLAMLVHDDSGLSNLWRQLSEPYDDFLAKAEDGTVPQYVAAAEAVMGTNNPGVISDEQIRKIQTEIEHELSRPSINDQLVSPEQYLQFWKATPGFRLLPPRRLPDAVCFQNTTYPKIPDRFFPSGLDFFAASPVLRSPASVRAAQHEFGKNVSDAILKADSGPMPDSLHGEAMQLLAKLQEPLPANVAPAMRSEAWGDLQLWTQLGAWAEQRHTWALHTKMNVEVRGMITPPPGVVAPYPEFFAGLAKLTRETAAAFEKAGLAGQFDVKTEANTLLNDLKLSDELRKVRDVDEYEKISVQLDQFNGFQNRYEDSYYEKHRAEMRGNGWQTAEKQIRSDLEALAERGANGQASAADTEILKMFFDCRQDIVRPLNDFAPVCDRLAVLAKKSLNGETLTEDDAKWIRDYGTTIAGFHFYTGDSYEVPQDNFPIVTRIFCNATDNSTLYAGLARPQALYIIIPTGNSLQLYRGAVLNYREFVRPNSELLDDDSWRAMILKGQTPPAPPFTKSFYAETSVAELLKKLQAQSRGEFNYGDMRDLLWQIGARATGKDLPALFDMLTQPEGDERADIVDGMAGVISQLPWEPCQKQIIGLLSSPDHELANAAAEILVAQPEAVDATALTSGFAQQPVHTRRLDCVILSNIQKQTQATHDVLLQALHDPEAVVRWQAALAIGKAGWNDDQSRSALLKTVDDTNEFVGAAAVYSLARLGATNTAPILLSTLKSADSRREGLENESMAIVQDTRNEQFQGNTLLNVDQLQTRVEIYNIRTYDLATAIIEALGNLRYAPAADELSKLQGSAYDVEVTWALGEIKSGRSDKPETP